MSRSYRKFLFLIYLVRFLFSLTLLSALSHRLLNKLFLNLPLLTSQVFKIFHYFSIAFNFLLLSSQSLLFLLLQLQTLFLHLLQLYLLCFKSLIPLCSPFIFFFFLCLFRSKVWPEKLFFSYFLFSFYLSLIKRRIRNLNDLLFMSSSSPLLHRVIKVVPFFRIALSECQSFLSGYCHNALSWIFCFHSFALTPSAQIHLELA